MALHNTTVDTSVKNEGASTTQDDNAKKKISILKPEELQRKLEMTNAPSCSPTSLLVKNVALLPSGIIHVDKWDSVKTGTVAKLKSASTSESTSALSSLSSGSATAMPRCCSASLISVMDDDGPPESLGLQIQDGNPRNKTVLTPGHSLMDWIRLGNSGTDLSGVGGIPRPVTLSELAHHNKQTDAWIAIRGIVFNVTRYMDFHPGGIGELMKGVGKDATSLFENVHAWVNYQSILQKCVVGRLSRGSTASSSTFSIASTTEKSVDATNHCSSTALDLIKKCSLLQRTIDQDILPSPTFHNISMDWKQTTNMITIFYKAIHNHVGVYYQLIRHSNSKLTFKVFLQKDIIIHEVELAADVDWPPKCKRNFDTMEVSFIFTKHIGEIWKCQGTSTLSKEDNVSRRTYNEYEVVNNVCLSPTVYLLVLQAKNYMQLIPIGRYIEAKLNIMGMEVSRSYTPVPPCLHPSDTVPNYKSDCICLIIKRYPDGTLTPSITALQPGQVLMLSSSLGAFVVESYDRYSVVHMLAAGTGLTAMLGIIQRSLARRSVKKINLINFNKNEDSMFYVSQLDRVCMEKKLVVTHVLSQPTDSWTGKRGIVTDELLGDLIGNCSPEGCVFLCGPEGFMKSAKICLEKLNWKPDQMYAFDD